MSATCDDCAPAPDPRIAAVVKALRNEGADTGSDPHASWRCEPAYRDHYYPDRCNCLELTAEAILEAIEPDVCVTLAADNETIAHIIGLAAADCVDVRWRVENGRLSYSVAGAQWSRPLGRLYDATPATLVGRVTQRLHEEGAE